MEEKDDWTSGREGDRHPFTEINLQDEFVTPITLVLNYILNAYLTKKMRDYKTTIERISSASLAILEHTHTCSTAWDYSLIMSHYDHFKHFQPRSHDEICSSES